MITAKTIVVVLIATVACATCAGYLWLRGEALSARKKPSNVEYDVANYALSLSIPRSAKRLKNPFTTNAAQPEEARRIYSDDCSVCHGIDGKGHTETAKGLSPEVPDLHADHIQKLTDGELFYIIRNGVRFTGMPSWDFRDDQIWNIVALIRQMKSEQKTSPASTH